MTKIAQYSPDIDDALKAARKFFSNREAQLIYEAQWRAELDRRYFEALRNETRDAERDARRDAERDANRDAERDAQRDRELDSFRTNKKRDYISRQLLRRWNVAPAEANAALRIKTNYDELNDISEHMEDCQSYQDFLKLLSNYK